MRLRADLPAHFFVMRPIRQVMGLTFSCPTAARHFSKTSPNRTANRQWRGLNSRVSLHLSLLSEEPGIGLSVE